MKNTLRIIFKKRQFADALNEKINLFNRILTLSTHYRVNSDNNNGQNNPGNQRSTPNNEGQIIG